MGNYINLGIPGSGSTPDFLRRAFPQFGPLEAVTADSGHVDDLFASLDDRHMHYRNAGYQVSTLIGVSVGAHTVARYAATHAVTADLILALPAWTNTDGRVAQATGLLIDDLEQRGPDTCLADMRSVYGDDWIVDELQRAWSTFTPPDLIRQLRGTAASRGPTLHELASIRNRCVIIGLRDDPLHPLSVAEQWSHYIPHAALVTLDRDDPGEDRSVFGQRAWSALKTM